MKNKIKLKKNSKEKNPTSHSSIGRENSNGHITQSALTMTLKAKMSEYTDAEDNPNGCFNWLGNINKVTGYGTLNHAGKKYSTHRLAYELAYGSIPQGLSILHSCDNRACVNTTHLRAGTAKDNTLDMKKRNRFKRIKKRGDEHKSTKISDREVLEIRRLAGIGTPTVEIANRFHCTRAYIRNIVLFKVRPVQKPEGI